MKPLHVMLLCRCLECGRHMSMLESDLEINTCECGGTFAVDKTYYPDHPKAHDFGPSQLVYHPYKPPVAKAAVPAPAPAPPGAAVAPVVAVSSQPASCDTCDDKREIAIATRGGVVKKLRCPDCSGACEVA